MYIYTEMSVVTEKVYLKNKDISYWFLKINKLCPSFLTIVSMKIPQNEFNSNFFVRMQNQTKQPLLTAK